MRSTRPLQPSCLEDAFYFVMGECWKRALRRVTRSPLSLAQYWALYVISSRNAIIMGDLCKEMEKSPSTMSQLVEGLARFGLVVQRRDPRHDRRVVLVRATSAGRRCCAAIRAGQKRLLAEMLGILSAEDRRHLARILDALGSAIVQQPEMRKGKN